MPKKNLLTIADLINHVDHTDSPFAHSPAPETALAITSLASTWMYIAPSIKAGEREHGEIGKALQLAGNTSCATLVVFNIGGHFIWLLESSRDLANFLRKNSQHSYRRTLRNCGRKFWAALKKNQLHVLTLAGLTATPLAAAAWFYKDYDGEPEILIGCKMSVTFAVYTLIHTLPVSFLLYEPWLNFLLVKIPKYVLTFPLIIGAAAYRSCRSSQETDQVNALTRKNLALREHIMNEIKNLITNLKAAAFVKEGWFYRVRPATEYQGSNLAETLSILAANPMAEKQPLLAHPSASSWWHSYSHYLSTGLRNILGSAGAALVGASIFGFLKVNYNLFFEWLGHSSLGALALLMPPAIVSEILTMYYGWLAFARAYDYLTSILSGHGHMPYAFKLNFGLSSAFLGITYFLNFFSYGTALQLTRDTCEPTVYGQPGCDALEFASKWGIIVYGCINMAELLEKLVEFVELHVGAQEKKQLITTINKLRRLLALLEQLDPKTCADMVDATGDNPSILAALKLPPDPESRNIATPPQTTELISKTSTSSCWKDWCCFWRHRPQTPPNMQSSSPPPSPSV